MSKSSESNVGGIGFLGLLTVVFITLKLTGHIDWSWWLVIAPIFVPISFMSVVFLFLVLLTAIKRGR